MPLSLSAFVCDDLHLRLGVCIGRRTPHGDLDRGIEAKPVFALAEWIAVGNVIAPQQQSRGNAVGERLGVYRSSLGQVQIADPGASPNVPGSGGGCTGGKGLLVPSQVEMG